MSPSPEAVALSEDIKKLVEGMKDIRFFNDQTLHRMQIYQLKQLRDFLKKNKKSFKSDAP